MILNGDHGIKNGYSELPICSLIILFQMGGYLMGIYKRHIYIYDLALSKSKVYPQMTLLIRHMILNHIQDLQGMRLANTLPKEIINQDGRIQKKNDPQLHM